MKRRRTFKKDTEDEDQPLTALAEDDAAGSDAEDDGALDSDLAVIRSFAGALGLEVLLPRPLLDRAPPKP